MSIGCCMKLSKYSSVNRTYFHKDSYPARNEWIGWIMRGIVVGKVIDQTPYVDLDWFDSMIISEPAFAEEGTDIPILLK